MDFADNNMSPKRKILILFGTRPETIKLAPIIRQLRSGSEFETVTISSSQHTSLLRPFLDIFNIESNYDLKVMTDNQTPNEVIGKILDKLDKVLESEKPDLILVQGDTSTTLAGAMAGFNRKIPVGHVEAGLRSGDIYSPFPEEMNRRLISQLATFHFAATERNRRSLLAENVHSENVYLTGNTVVDALKFILKNLVISDNISALIGKTSGLKRILLTTHRRESFGETMSENLKVIREFVEKNARTCLIFPVHPNPNVRGIANDILSGHDRIHLIEPLDYRDFIGLARRSWLIVSDSGGVQEEAPTLGKPVLILRENTERPEAIRAGVAKLVGGKPKTLKRLLEENYAVDSWVKSVREVANPFGDGRSAQRIVDIILRAFETEDKHAGAARK